METKAREQPMALTMAKEISIGERAAVKAEAPGISPVEPHSKLAIIGRKDRSINGLNSKVRIPCFEYSCS